MKRIQHAPCGVLTLDVDGKIIFVNATLLSWLKREDALLEGQHIESILSRVSKIMFYSYFYPTIFMEGHVNEMLIKLNDVNEVSKSFILNARKTVVHDEVTIDCVLMQMDKRVNYEKELKYVQKETQLALQKKEQAFQDLERIYREIEVKQRQLQEMNEKLEVISTLDQLTGVYNRHYFTVYLNEQMILATEEAYVFSLIIIDIDFFKNVNDTYGHLAGDFVLAKLAKLLKEYISGLGIVTRYGGEEFVLVLPNKNKEQAMELASYLNRLVANQDFTGVGQVTISLGVSTVRREDTATTIFKRADDALYAAKRNGRNQACHINDL